MRGCIFQFLFCLFFIFNESKATFLGPLVRCVTDIVSICSRDNNIADARWQAGEQLVDDFDVPPFTGTEPTEYTLKIIPDLKEKMFKGEVIIKVFASRATKIIELNSEKLCIEHVSVETWDLPRVIESQFKLDKKKNLLIITMSTPLQTKRYYNVRIIFEGFLYEHNPFGFALYEDLAEPAFMAETVLDPFFARKAFPCYDAPQYTAAFTLIMCRVANEKIIANMPSVLLSEYRTRPECLTFQSKNAIPTNMVYFAVLEDGYEQMNRRLIYSVWTTRKYLDQVSYAADELESLAETMKSLFALKDYDLSRIDLVVPIHHENKSMLLTYMKRNLLCDTRFCPRQYQENVTKNIVHQLSKFWFNSYVSIQTWDHLWLRDGLGVYYGYKLASMIKPDWRMSHLHGSIFMQSTLNDDRKTFFQPLVHSHDMSKREIFKTIYSDKEFNFYNNKASLIIRMLEFIVGESTFDKAMIWFLRDGHKNGGLVPPNNLWHAFERQVIQDRVQLNLPHSTTLTDIMNKFVTQVGYPLLEVTESVGDDLRKTLKIRQMPYEPYRINLKRDEEILDIGTSKEWIVPIRVMAQDDEDNINTKLQWLTAADEHLLVETAINESQWFILNPSSTVYCRVNYSHDNWKLLTAQLRDDPNKIPALNRAQLIADSHQLLLDQSEKIEISTIVPVRILSYLHKEHDPIVWMVALNQFKRLYSALTSEARDLYKDFFVNCLKYEFTRTVDFQINRNHPNKMWQKEMLEFLCWIGDVDCVGAAVKEYLRNEDDLTRIDPDLQYVVFCTLLRGGPSSELVEAKLKTLLENNNSSCLEETIRKAFGCRHVPLEPGSLKSVYEALLQRTINKDPAGEIIANDLLSRWDALSPFLEMMYDRILSMTEPGVSQPQPRKDIFNAEIDGLIKFAKLLKGRHFGISEVLTFLKIWKKLHDLPLLLTLKFKKLSEAFGEVLVSGSFDSKIDNIGSSEVFLRMALRSNKCGHQPASSLEVELSNMPGVGLFSVLGSTPPSDTDLGADSVDEYIEDIRNGFSDDEDAVSSKYIIRR